MIGWHSKNFILEDPEPLFFVNSISPIINESLIDMGWDLQKNKLKITGMWSIVNPSNEPTIPTVPPRKPPPTAPPIALIPSGVLAPFSIFFEALFGYP